MSTNTNEKLNAILLDLCKTPKSRELFQRATRGIHTRASMALVKELFTEYNAIRERQIAHIASLEAELKVLEADRQALEKRDDETEDEYDSRIISLPWFSEWCVKRLAKEKTTKKLLIIEEDIQLCPCCFGNDDE